MTNAELQLFISSGRHATRPQARINEVENSIGPVDVVFEEVSAESVGWSTVALNGLAMPLLVGVMYLWTCLLKGVEKATGKTDETIVKDLVDEHGADRVQVDANIHRLLADARREWFIGHSIVAVLAAEASPEFISDLPGSAPTDLVTLLFLTAVGLLAFFLAGTLHTRDIHMAREIEAYAGTDEAATACLVVGKGHDPGIRSALENTERVEVVNRIEG